MTFSEFILDHTFAVSLLLLSFCVAVWAHLQQKEVAFKFSLFLFAFCLALLYSMFDPFLNMWDERFHALVAKNMMSHPFKPTLYEEVLLNIDQSNWDKYHIWVHKQPLFLWQICTSFKLFGVSEISLRLPSVLLFAIQSVLIFRIGELLVSKRSGFIAALLMITCPFLLQLVVGRAQVDHNDLSFVFYVTMSIWAWIEYISSKKWFYVIIVGIAAGAAILCKWLPGLLVYLGWMIYYMQTGFTQDELKKMLSAIMVTTAIALPWQMWTLIKFPEETKFVFLQNAQHFTIALDGHTGSVFYHLEIFNLLYGKFTLLFIIPAMIILYHRMQNRKVFVSLISMLLFTYLFFSIAASKMPAFTLIAMPIVLVSLGVFGDSIFIWLSSVIKQKGYPSVIFVLFVISILIYRLDVATISAQYFNYGKGSHSEMLTHNKKLFTSLKAKPSDVIFNVYGRHYIECMFYTGCIAYNFIPDEQQVSILKRNARGIVVFKNKDELPEYILNDPYITVLNDTVNGYW